MFLNRKIGIHLGPNYIAVSEKYKNRAGRNAFSDKRYPLNNSNCSVAGIVDNKGVVDELAKYVAERISGNYCDIYVSIADPYLKSVILHDIAGPSKQQDIDRYIKWKIKNDHFIDTDSSAVTYQVFQTSGGSGYRVLAQVCDLRLIKLITEAFLRVSIPIKVVDASYSYVHNFMSSFIDKSSSCLLIHLDGYWVYSSSDDGLFPKKIKSQCVIEYSGDDKRWEDMIDKMYGTISRKLYAEFKGGSEYGSPEIYLVGNIHEEYSRGWDEYFATQYVRDEKVTSGLKDYFSTDGYLAIERLAAVCQR